MKKYEKPIVEKIAFKPEEQLMGGIDNGPSTETGFEPMNIQIEKIGL